MGTQAQSSSGKSAQPPEPNYTATTKPMEMGGGGGFETKPMQMGAAPAAAPSAPTYQYQYADGSTGSSPWVRDAQGNVALDANGSVQEGRFLSSSSSPAQASMSVMGAGGTAASPMGGMKGYTGGSGDGGGYGAEGAGNGASFGGGGFGATAVQGPINDESRRRVEAAILSRLEPQFKSDEARMRNQLLSSGLEVGSPAYTSELQRLQQGQNDARQQAVLTGGTEESRQVGMNANLQQQAFGQGLQGAQFDNATRQQMLSELLLQRNTPLNELNALRTGGQVSMPTFGGYYTNNAQAAPMFDAATAQGNYDAQQAAQQQSGFNAVLGAGATAAGMFF